MKRLKISAGFAIMISAFFFFDSGRLFPVILFCAIIHELGHFLAVYFFGSKVSSLRLELTGAVIVYDNSKISYAEEAAIAFMGPLFGIILAVISASFSRYGSIFSELAGASFTLSALNLLPVRSLDGGRILFALLSRYRSGEAATKVLIVSGCAVSLAVLAGGVYILKTSGFNYTFLLAGLWILYDLPNMRRLRRTNKRLQ